MLVVAVRERLGMPLSASTVRHARPYATLAWGRPRLAMPRTNDPQKAAQQWASAQAVSDASPEVIVRSADASRIQVLPVIRAMGHWRGQQLRVPTPGSTVTRSLVGARTIRTGQWTHLVRDHLSTEDVSAVLDHLVTVSASGPIIVIGDNYISPHGWRGLRLARSTAPAAPGHLATLLRARESGRDYLAAAQKRHRRQSLARIAPLPPG